VTIVKYLAVICTAASAYAVTPGCVPPQISPGGEAVVTRFLAAPLPRAHEVVADAMQAAGVALFKNTEQFIEGERVDERVRVLRLHRGDEALRAELAPRVQEGKAGTLVRVETRRRANKKGAPKHAWSAAILDQSACLVSLLSLDDPARRPNVPRADGPEVRVADATSVMVRSRHFLFNTDLKANHVIPFETAEDLVINDSIVIPAGSLVAAYIEQENDIGEYGHGAAAQLRFKFLTLPDGTRLPMRGIVDLQGKEVGKPTLVVGTVLAGVNMLAATGSGFAIPAGTQFRAEVDGEQKVRASRATAPAKGHD
jgi:hypothetical protein